MTEKSIIAYIEMQYLMLSDPIKKVKLTKHIQWLKKYKCQVGNEISPMPITNYLKKELNNAKKNSFEHKWLMLCLKIFELLDAEISLPNSHT